MTLTLDGSTPAAVHLSASTSATAATASFSPPAGSLVVIAVNIGYKVTTATGPGVTCADSLSNSYTAGPSDYDTRFDGSWIFTRFYSSAPGSITVTVTRTGALGLSLYQLTPYVLTGAAASQAGAASAHTINATSGTTWTSSVSPTVAGSWNIVAASIGNNQGSFTPAGLTTDESFDDTSDGNSGAAGHFVTVTPGAATLGWTGTTPAPFSWAALEILPVTTHAGAAALSGTGTLTGAGVFAGAAALSGTGTLTGTPAHLTSHGHGAAALDGNGTLNGAGTGTFIQVAALSGIGTLAATWTGTLVQPPATLAGAGTLQLSGVKLGFTAGLSGNGTLSVLQATGGLRFASPGAATPYAYPLSSVVMVAPPGTTAWRPLGSVGTVTALTYSFTCPGGADKMSCTVMAPAAYRTQLFNPGWQVKITRGGHQVWSGKLDEPVPGPSGWTLTAVGTGNRGQDFLATYTSTWPHSEPDEPVDAAISRGLPWVNPGVGSPAGAWYGQAVDTGAQTVSGLLSLICTRGGLTWYVNSQPGGTPGDDLTVFPLPTAVNRLLVCTDPVPRTLGGDINTIVLRYQSAADDPGGTGAAAVFSTTSVQNSQSVAAHQVIETYVDLSSAGTMTAAAAQAVGSSILAIYQRASFAGLFTARYGQLTNTGGVPVDPGADQAGTVVKLILADFGYGGEVTPQFPVTFIVGGYEWDDLAQTATITPYQNVDQSLTGLLSLASTELTPITVVG